MIQSNFLAMKREQISKTNRTLPYFALVIGVLALSFSALFVRWADAPGTITSFYRMSVASLILAPIWASRRKGQVGSIRKYWFLPLIGGLFTALDHGIWSTSIATTRIANATLLNNMAPLWVALFAVLIWKEKLGAWFWVGLFLALSGATIVMGHDLITNPHLTSGDFLALLSSLFYAGYFLITQIARSKLRTLSYIWLVDISAALFLLIFNLILREDLVSYSANTWLVFLATAVISQITGYFSIGYALGHLPASVVSPTMVAQPVLTALMAIPLAGEPLDFAQLLGGLAVLGGIYLLNRAHTGNQSPVPG